MDSIAPGRIKLWTRCAPSDLWSLWREQFVSDDEAIAHAVWIANRLVKDKARSTRTKFYSLKDEFIRRYGSVGQLVREETKTCYGCGGSGIAWDGFDCLRCEGTGVYSRRCLYVHEFEVAGQKYRMHSYVEPKTLLEGRAEDLEQYGGKFTEQELDAMALPMTGLVKVLSYVAVMMWGLKWYGDRYG